MQIKLATEKDLIEINLFHQKQSTFSVYQSVQMFRFYEKVKFYKPFLFYAQLNNHIESTLLAVQIKESSGLIGFFSSRILVFGGPILSDKSEKLLLLDEILSHLVQKLKNKSIFIQFRNFFEWCDKEKMIFAKHGFHFRERQNILLDLSNKELVLKNMSESKRRQIRLANKHGIQLRAPKNILEVRVFHNILKNLYKTQIRKPLPGFSFFSEFYKKTKEGLGIIRLVVINNEIIGGVLAPITAGDTIYYWYVAGLDQEFKECYPSVMAVWSLVLYGLEHNISKLDFMGIGKPNQNYGVREFKLRFSKNILDFGRFGRRNNKLLYPLAEFGFNVLRSFKQV
jgi:lipid II:glycine glycyltransferase (peptidoglycan interpeptide bridge formation enzyme)